jgi:hypothetical protein
MNKLIQGGKNLYIEKFKILIKDTKKTQINGKITLVHD